MHVKKRTIYAVILSVIFFCIVMIVFLLLFQIRTIEVEGNEYLTKEEVVQWVQEDEWSANSVYLICKNQFMQQELLPAMDEVSISLKTPWSVKVKVKEKTIVGYLIVEDDFVYFDEDGIVLEKSREWRDDMACIEGLGVTEVQLFKELPVSKENKKVFKQLLEMSASLKKYELAPDKIICIDSELVLKFGTVYVNIGNEKVSERISQITPILEKLEGQTGTLWLNDYNEDKKIISFEKDKIPEEKKENTDQSE